MFAAIVLFTTWVLLGIPVAIVTIPWAIVSRNVLPLYRGSLWVVRTGLYLAGIRVEAVWEQPLDLSQHYLFLSNHVSNLDPPVLLPLLPERSSAFLKRSLMKIPILGWGMKRADFIPVDRDGRVESAVESMEFATRVLKSGVNVLSFVEGTRSRDGRLQPFKKGPFYPGDALWRAGGAGIHLGHGENDEEGQPENLSWNCARGVSRAHPAARLFQQRRSDGRGARGHCLGITRVDAGLSYFTTAL